jgi:sterol 3beta-glucosyltransferase
VPNIVVPFTSDQPFWARRVHALGVSPEPIPARKLAADRLAAAIVEAVNDQDMRRRAWEIGERVRAENGVRQAVQIVQAQVESVTA